jgi:hypothetical protein
VDASATPSIVPPPNAYVSGGVTDDSSIGLFTPYGLKLERLQLRGPGRAAGQLRAVA